MLKIKDKKDRGTVTIQVFALFCDHDYIKSSKSSQLCSYSFNSILWNPYQVLYHEFSKEEQLAALEEEKRIIEERKKLKEAGVIGSTMDALDGAASVVGSGVGMVGAGIAGGAGLVGSGLNAGAGIVGSGLGAVGSGLSKAGKFMGRTITGSSASRRSGTSTPVNPQENGGSKPKLT